MTATLVAILVLLVFSGFFSASETALTAASKPLLHQMAQEGNPRAIRVSALLDHKERLLGAILLGNNLVNILASALATSVLITVAGEAGVAYATVIMTLIVLIFGEILPKTYAIHNATGLALAVSPIIRAIVWLLTPFVAVIHAFTGTVLTLFRGRIGSRQDMDTALAELRGAIEMHAGEEVRHERAMLRSILDLSEVEVGEIMTHRKSVAMLDADQPPGTLLEQVLESRYTRLPLWSGEPDNIVGVLHAKALLRAVRATGDIEQVDPVALASPPWFIPESTSLFEQLQAFRDRREHFALVVDEYGAFQGIVTLEDILEEIVGEISDEHDLAVTGVRPQPDGAFVVAGDMTIRDLNRDLDWNLPDEPAATVAGLVLHESRMIPEVGQTFLFHGFRFEILRRHRNQITALRITPPRPGEGAAEGA